MSTETTTTAHAEALELIDRRIEHLTEEINRDGSVDDYLDLHHQLQSLRKSRGLLDGSTPPDFITALGNRMANTERERGNRPVLRPDLEERHRLCAIAVTLNGNPARISGTVNDFATVTDTKSGLSAEWSWYTVARIVETGGRFTS